MSENNEFDMFDPTGMVKNMRDASLDAYAKMMIELVNTDAYAEAQGAMLDAWLANSGPFRKAMENVLAQHMANMNLPTLSDVSRLAERLTNIEMRLDDMDAKLDAALRAPQKKNKSSKGEK